MFAFAAALLVVAAIACVVVMTRNDRPNSPPRSHGHEVDQFAAQMRIF